MKQDIGQQKPLYVNEDNVIAWASHWGHWWIQDSEDAGKNRHGYWLQQDDKDNCPGSEKVIARSSGSDRVQGNATITPSSQCKVLIFWEHPVVFLSKMIHKPMLMMICPY